MGRSLITLTKFAHYWPPIYHISSYKTAGIIILCSLQMRVLLEKTTFLLHKVIRIAGIIRDAGIIQARVLYEKIRYLTPVDTFRRENLLTVDMSS